MLVDKLLQIASPPVCHSFGMAGLTGASRGQRFHELQSMLRARNGFFVFEGALHVLPWAESGAKGELLGVQAWNEMHLWRSWYQSATEGLLFFAEDAFGGQFAIKGDDIVAFNPETAEVSPIASSIEDWAGKLLIDYRELTGYPVAHSWQLINGAIPDGKRLLPKVPFVLGGSYEHSNLFAIDSVKGMRYRGELWQQIRDLPDGARVTLKALPSQ